MRTVCQTDRHDAAIVAFRERAWKLNVVSTESIVCLYGRRKKAIVYLYIVNWLVFITEEEYVY